MSRTDRRLNGYAEADRNEVLDLLKKIHLHESTEGTRREECVAKAWESLGATIHSSVWHDKRLVSK